MATTSADLATFAKAVTYTGGIGTVVVEAKPVTLTAITLNGGAAGATFRVFDNATTNTGQVLFAATVATGISTTYALPLGLKALNGVTINASAAGGAGSIHAFSGTSGVVAKSATGGLTAATVIEDHAPNVYSGFSVNASNTGGACTITVYDNASAASGVILQQVTIPTQAAANTQFFLLPTNVKPTNGVTISVATTAVGDITFWVA